MRGVFFFFIWINGRPLKPPFNPLRGYQEPGPFVTAGAGRVLMPVRFFTEALGGTVTWDGAADRVTLQWQGRQVVLRIGEGTALVGGRPVALDQPPLLFLDRTFVPARFLLEFFGARVDWDRAGLSARIELPGAACISTLYCGETR
jgi:hypothetical protein